MVLPTANPLTYFEVDACLNPILSFCLSAPKPKITTPLQYGSFCSIRLSSKFQLFFENGGSFHQSGFIPMLYIL
jgi:hypothetical protein